MQVNQKNLLDLIGEPGAVFEIPEYQRGYTWTWRQCRELWLDIMRAERGGWKHFTGMMFCQRARSNQAGVSVLEIADGQQRITTTMLLLAALASKLDSLGEVAGVPSGNEIRARYLAVSDGKSSKLHPKGESNFASLVLKPRVPPTSPQEVQKDPLAIAKEDESADTYESNMRYFERLMSQDDFDAAYLWRGLNRLTVISALLEQGDSGEEVFESLNGKGVQLCLADMLRNYLMASWDESEQMRLYNTYWVDIDGIFAPDPGSRRLDNAIYGWLAVRYPKARAHSPEDLYSAFKRFVEDEYAGTSDDLLAELRSFALVWAENYRYHGSKKYKSASWAKIGAHTLTSDYKLKEPDHPELAEKMKADARKVARYW